MSLSKRILNFEKLVNLFFLFVIGSIGFWVYFFLPIPEFSWKVGLKFSILLLALLIYEFVLISLMSHYLAKAKKRFAESIQKNKEFYSISLALIFGLTYIVLDTFIEKSGWVFFRDLILILLIILAMPGVSRLINKKYVKKPRADH